MSFGVIIERAHNLSDIAFALTATILAILTYLRAKETFLQPVRTEVIKKQTNLLIELITLVDKEINLLKKIDYDGVIRLNLFDSFLKCGSIFNEHEKVEKYVKESTRAGIFFPDENGLVDAEIIPSFDENPKEERGDYKRKIYEDAKGGKFRISVLNLTESHIEFEKKLIEIKESPFLPKAVSPLVEQLEKDVRVNITEHVRGVVEEAVNEAFNKRGGNKMPNIAGVYNSFNRLRISHQPIADALRVEVRKYLKIDSMP